MNRLLGGRYALERRIGEGGMSEVFLASDQLRGGAKVVVKRCRAHLAHETEFAQLFLREARLSSLIHHENVVELFATGDDEGLPYLVMEYLEGFTLRDVFLRAPKAGGIPQDIAAAIIAASARGLDATHRAVDEKGKPMQLVHRDVSPHNLFVTEAGVVKVLDFGIAKGAHDVTTTRAGHVKGKASYLAPEQLVPGAKVDPRTDVFTLGIVAWETFTGKRLFKRTTEVATIQAIRALQVPHPRALKSDVDEGYAQTVMKMLEAKPERRFATSAAVAQAFEQHLKRRLSAQTGASKAGPDAQSLLVDLVARVREVAPAEDRNTVPPVEPPRTREAQKKAFADAWGGEGEAPAGTGPTAAKRSPKEGDENTATVVPPVAGAWAQQLRGEGVVRGGQAAQTRSIPRPGPSAAASTVKPGGQFFPTSTQQADVPADGSVVGTLAVAGVLSAPEASGGWEELGSHDLELALTGETASMKPPLSPAYSDVGGRSPPSSEPESLDQEVLEDDEIKPTVVDKSANNELEPTDEDDGPTLVDRIDKLPLPPRNTSSATSGSATSPQSTQPAPNSPVNLAELLVAPSNGDLAATRPRPPPAPVEQEESSDDPTQQLSPAARVIWLAGALLLGLLLSYAVGSLIE